MISFLKGTRLLQWLIFITAYATRINICCAQENVLTAENHIPKPTSIGKCVLFVTKQQYSFLTPSQKKTRSAGGVGGLETSFQLPRSYVDSTVKSSLRLFKKTK